LDCTINGEDVSIMEYLNAQQVGYMVDLAKGAGYSIAKQLGFTGDQPYIVGYNWIVTAKTVSTIQQMKDAIGDSGKITVVHCS
jgi:hypothetical protein